MSKYSNAGFLEKATIVEGDVIHNKNAHSYDVLATRTFWSGMQDFLLRDKQTNTIVIAENWMPDKKGDAHYGTWQSATYYDVLPVSRIQDLKDYFIYSRG